MSVFTYGTAPERVSSPWLQQGEQPSQPITKLGAEPQEGPTEYKLHLLLRPRRAYKIITPGVTSESQWVSRDESAGLPFQTTSPNGTAAVPASVEAKHRRSEHFSTTAESRRERLFHLTTQLLWRLQQSTEYTPLGTTESLIPQLPDDSVNLAEAVKPGSLWQGLEESRGALYEIGVSDDGTLVGLPEDEINESLLTLRVMAASLGCDVEITRKTAVGECIWSECANDEVKLAPTTQRGKLWVVEAFVKPYTGVADRKLEFGTRKATPRAAEVVETASTSDQLRVTLTGPTTCGKSTLLGTLSTGIIDNGAGSSRTFSLRHRHELASGMTTSVSHMLLGYKSNAQGDDRIFSFSDPNIDSWEGIHDVSRDGRLVFVVDSAGHLRFRRAILRGLVGWAPHWTVFCLAADDAEGNGRGSTAPTHETLGASAVSVDMAMSHLELCLKLRVPLVIVVTKLDLASNASLRNALTKVRTAVRKEGREAKFVLSQRRQPDPTRIPAEDERAVRPVIEAMTTSGDLLKYVPVISTSAVKGEGFGLLHALLQNLPLPQTPAAHDYIGMALNPEQPSCVFHIEDKFSLPASYGTSMKEGDQADRGTVVAGYLRFGRFSVGNRVVVGPFPSEEDESQPITPDDRSSPGGEGLSISHPSTPDLYRTAMKNAVAASSIKGQWYNAQIVTIRNLRLPVRTLEPGQVGTIGIVFDLPDEDLSDSIFERPPPSMPKIRKGMVLAIPSKHMIDTGLSLQAASGITAEFGDAMAYQLIEHSIVTIYAASVRATARILRVSPARREKEQSGTFPDDAEDVFEFQVEQTDEQGPRQDCSPLVYRVQLELLTHREWIELGSQVVILEGGSRDKTGLEGYVGKVIEITE